jgi:hypothetical protein
MRKPFILLLILFIHGIGFSQERADSVYMFWPGITKKTNQQVIYPSSNMPRVDIHTHMDSKTNYAKAVDSMDQWVRARPR